MNSMDTMNPKQTDDTDSSHSRPDAVGENQASGRGRSLSRVAAIVVLVPAVPGLLGSVGAMLLFYVSPAHFNKLLTMLPGETILRSLLFFAPTALFAVVLLAVLYARQGAAPAEVEVRQTGSPVVVQFAARTGLIFGVPGMLAATVLLLLNFVSPARYDAFLEPLPGTRYIDALLPFLPLVLLFVVVPALLVVTNLVRFGKRPERRRTSGDAAAKFSRAMVLVILIPSVLLLGMAVAALAMSYVSPAYFAKLLVRLTSEGVIRLGMLFGSSALLAVVLISSLFLLMRPARTSTDEAQTAAGEGADGTKLQKGQTRPPRTGLIWLFSTGLFFTLTSSIALFGLALYLLIR